MAFNWTKHLEELKQKYIGQVCGDYSCIDVLPVKAERVDRKDKHFEAKLQMRCNVCGNVKLVTPGSFRRDSNKHGVLSCFKDDMETRVAVMRNKYVGQKRSDYICIDAIPSSGANKNRIDLVIQCVICGKTKVIQIGNFERLKWGHRINCTRYKDYVGQTFGDMQILELIYKSSYPWYRIKCLKCNREYVIESGKFLDRENQSHDFICWIGKGSTRFKSIWSKMKHRCNNPADKNYKDYGGRGIGVEWIDYPAFYQDMWESYKTLAEQIGEKNVSIERIDVNGNYCKENCKWIHIKEQAGNKRTTVYFKATSPTGLTYYSRNLRKFCIEHNINYGNMIFVLKGKRNICRGWSGEYITKEEWEYRSAQQLSWNASFAIDIIHEILKFRKVMNDVNMIISVKDLIDRGVKLDLRVIDELVTNSNKYHYEIMFNPQENYLYIQEEEPPSV